MIPRKFRLSGKGNIEKVKRDGRSVQSDTFGLKYLKNSSDLNSRFGLVVSKKISAKAVIRNKIKRMIRYSFMQLAPAISEDYDILLFAKKNILGSSTASVLKELKESLEKEGIIK